MDAPPNTQSVRKLDGRTEKTRVALGVEGGLGEAGVRGRVSRGLKTNFQCLTAPEQVNALLEGRLASGIGTPPLHCESLCGATLGNWSLSACYRGPKPSFMRVPTRNSWRCSDIRYSCLVTPFFAVLSIDLQTLWIKHYLGMAISSNRISAAWLLLTCTLSVV
jgi:hypothetical protein